LGEELCTFRLPLGFFRGPLGIDVGELSLDFIDLGFVGSLFLLGYSMESLDCICPGLPINRKLGLECGDFLWLNFGRRGRRFGFRGMGVII
jgi:hypothetical protein